MENWQGLPPDVRSQYAVVRVVKKNSQKELVLLEDRATGARVLLRNYPGELSDVYQVLAGKPLKNIPQVLVAAERPGGYYVLEKFIEGHPPLPGQITGSALLRILHQLCDALSSLHALGIVHRDVKPDNLIIAPDGSVFLTDLDAARLYKSYTDHDTCMLGTTGFAAPEQFGIVQTDHRADIFALGITLNILQTGFHPSQQLCTGWLRKLVLKCTMLDPNARYQTAEEVWKAASLLSLLSPERGIVRKYMIPTAVCIGLCLLLLLPSMFPSVLSQSGSKSIPSPPSKEETIPLRNETVVSLPDSDLPKPPLKPDSVPDAEPPLSPPSDGSTEPVSPEATANTENTVNPSKPAQPENSVKPVKHVDPENPEKPVNPDEPENPEKPVNPDEQENPEKPVNPDEPDNPEEPVNPDKPVKPTESENPDKPVKPAEPVEPSPEKDHPSGSGHSPFVPGWDTPDSSGTTPPDSDTDTPDSGKNPDPPHENERPVDPNDITQKEGYDEVKAAHDDYCRKGKIALDAMASYEEWLTMPYYQKQQDLLAAEREAQIHANDCYVAAVVKKEELEALQAEDPSDEAAIDAAQKAYDAAYQEQLAATEVWHQKEAERRKYEQSAEYLTGKQEEDRRWRVYQEANSESGDALIHLNNMVEKYGIDIPVRNDSYK